MAETWQDLASGYKTLADTYTKSTNPQELWEVADECIKTVQQLWALNGRFERVLETSKIAHRFSALAVVCLEKISELGGLPEGHPANSPDGK